MPDDPLTLQDALALHRLDMQARRLSPATVENYRYMLSPFVDFLEREGVNACDQITSKHIRVYLATLRAQGKAAATQHTAARCIKAWLNFLVRDGELETSPMAHVPMPRLSKKLPVAFSKQDVETLTRYCYRTRDKAVILCLLDTGCRAAEFVALNVGDVDLSSGAVRVRSGKGDKERTVYLGHRARRALFRYLAQRRTPPSSSPLWVIVWGERRLSSAGLRMLLRRLAQRSGVERCTAHTFRRTFALWSLRAGMNIYALQRLMGHASLTMLRRYLALAESDLERAHRNHGPVDHYL